MTTETKTSEPLRLHEKVLAEEGRAKALEDMTRARDAAIAMIPHLQDRLSEAAEALNTEAYPDIRLGVQQRGISVSSRFGGVHLSWQEITEAQTNRIVEEIGIMQKRADTSKSGGTNVAD